MLTKVAILDSAPTILHVYRYNMITFKTALKSFIAQLHETLEEDFKQRLNREYEKFELKLNQQFQLAKMAQISEKRENREKVFRTDKQRVNKGGKVKF